MGQWTEYYCDPSIAGDSGAGTVGDPWGDLEYSIAQIAAGPGRDTSNGDRINVKTGTDEVLVAALDITGAYGTPTRSAPLVIQGYTTAADDRGVGGISGGSAVSICTQDVILHFIDMHLHTVGARPIITEGNSNWPRHYIRCEINGNSGSNNDGIGNGAHYGRYIDCYFHDIGGSAIDNPNTAPLVRDCVFETCAVDTTSGGVIKTSGNGPTIEFNCILVDDLSPHGLLIQSPGAHILHNSIHSSVASTHRGMHLDGEPNIVENNIVEGFSGAGGVGFYQGSDNYSVFEGNAVYNCTSAYNQTRYAFLDGSDNETLGSAPFNDPTNLDFSINDVGNLRATTAGDAGAWPLTTLGGTQKRYFSKGAIQVQPSAGGGGGTIRRHPKVLGGS